MTPLAPIDFTVPGIPAVPGSRPRRKEAWRAAVAVAARAAYGERLAPLAREVAIAFVYFHVGPAGRDIDNIAKLLFDSLRRVVIEDDSQVVEMRARRTELVEGLVLQDVRPALAREIEAGTPHFVYVRISDPPDPRRLP